MNEVPNKKYLITAAAVASVFILVAFIIAVKEIINVKTQEPYANEKGEENKKYLKVDGSSTQDSIKDKGITLFKDDSTKIISNPEQYQKTRESSKGDKGKNEPIDIEKVTNKALQYLDDEY